MATLQQFGPMKKIWDTKLHLYPLIVHQHVIETHVIIDAQ